VTEGVFAECRMEGDTFEMEDQRNWSDASYKTYVRPLELPWPYALKAGVPIRQTITLSIKGHAAVSAAAASAKAGQVILSHAETLGALPAIGLAVRPEDMNANASGVINTVKPQRLLLHFDPDAGHGIAQLHAYCELTSKRGVAAALELALPCKRSPEDELKEIAAWVRASGLKLSSLTVSPSVDRQSTPPGSQWPDCPPLEEVYSAARAAFPGVELGGGMLSYFTELNRKRVPADTLDFITHATNPIVHAADDISVMQTLEALPFITRSVRAFYGSKPYHIGPSSIAMRQNPYGSATKANPDLQRMPMASRDPRHNGLFGAAWTAGYAAQVVSARPATLTLSAATGPFGLMAGPGEPVPEGGMRPLFHVIKWLAAHAGWEAAQCDSSDGTRAVCVLAASSAGRRAAMIANLTAEQITLDIASLGFGLPDTLAVMDENKMSPAWQPLNAGPLALDAFAVAFLSDESP
jgi:D-apionolactonase